MHPALMLSLMEERERELARRARHAWKRPAPQPGERRPQARSARRLSAALARAATLFG